MDPDFHNTIQELDQRTLSLNYKRDFSSLKGSQSHWTQPSAALPAPGDSDSPALSTLVDYTFDENIVVQQFSNCAPEQHRHSD